jgi:hypothetical protein
MSKNIGIVEIFVLDKVRLGYEPRVAVRRAFCIVCHGKVSSLVLLPLRQGAQAENQMPDPLSGSLFSNKKFMPDGCQFWSSPTPDLPKLQ